MRALAILIVCAVTRIASAHPLDTGYLRVDATSDGLAITFDIDVALAAQELKVEPAAVDAALPAGTAKLVAMTYRTAALQTADGPCTWGTVAASRKGTTVTFTETVKCPPGNVTWDLSFVKKLAATFTILGKVRVGETERVITIDKTTTSIDIARSGGVDAGTALWQGIEHVGLVPAGWRNGLPAGLECLLLAIVMMLGGGSLKKLLIQAWTFAVGSGLAALLPVPAHVGAIGLMIAIAAIAGSVVTRKLEDHRYVIAGVAGVCHGIALTGAMGHPIGFAGGFAIAQLALVVLLGPLALVALRQTIVDKRVAPVLAIALSLIAIYWVARGL